MRDRSISRRSMIAALPIALGAQKRPAILVRSLWQTINIGDIAHAPGLLALLDRHIPEANLILWPNAFDRGVDTMFGRHFPKVRIVRGGLTANGNPESAELKAAFAEASLFIHGSAASITSHEHVEAWRKTGKPYGFFGVGFTLNGEAAGAAASDTVRRLASAARFLFMRETASLANVKQAGIPGAQGPEVGFVPDATFSTNIRDAAKATAFLRANALEAGRFAAFIPRLRYTPYQLIRTVAWTPAETERRMSVNARHQETDHAKLRAAIVAWVRRTGHKALLCPEMTYQLDIIDPLLYDPLPADVKAKVVRRQTYWITDEAASVYRQAAAVVSCECHSPILAAVQGVPCLYVRQPEDGIKGQMWHDLDLGDWCPEIEHTTGPALAAKLLEITGRPRVSSDRVRAAVLKAQQIQEQAMGTVRKALG